MAEAIKGKIKSTLGSIVALAKARRTTGIEWTTCTWNPTTGCTKVGHGCKICYAEVAALMMQKNPNAKVADRYRHGFKPTMQPDKLEAPLHWRKPRKVFVNSMSDLFHEAFPLTYIKAVFDVMNRCPQHQFQVLTKRADRLAKVAHELNWTENIWIGVSVEMEQYFWRIDELRKVPTENRFLSIEPLLEPLPNLDLTKMGWVIVGGESGSKKARPMQENWVTPIRDQCLQLDIPFFFKQWGGVRPKSGGKTLQGRTWCEIPA